MASIGPEMIRCSGLDTFADVLADSILSAG
jgi:hypothetical protein